MLNLPSKFVLNVYKALFLLYLNYCVIIWGFTTKNFKKLPVLQNKAIRIIFGLKIIQNVDNIRSQYKLFNVKQLITRFSCVFIHQEVLYDTDDSPFHGTFRYSNFTGHSQ